MRDKISLPHQTILGGYSPSYVISTSEIKQIGGMSGRDFARDADDKAWAHAPCVDEKERRLQAQIRILKGPYCGLKQVLIEMLTRKEEE